MSGYCHPRADVNRAGTFPQWVKSVNEVGISCSDSPCWHQQRHLFVQKIFLQLHVRVKGHLSDPCWARKRPLKMICNDFLVVRVNCWSYVFNIMKYMWKLRNVKNKNMIEKTSESAHRWFVYFSQVMMSYQENTTKQPIECWMLTTDRTTTHRHDDKRRNRFLKHKRVK